MTELIHEEIKHENILEFWFAEATKKRWFNATDEFDQSIRLQFNTIWEQASQGNFDHWLKTPHSALALVIVLDQFPLNMFRGTAKSFSTETDAINASRTAISLGHDKNLSSMQLPFLYLPFMHSENLEDQNQSVKLFTQAGLENNLRFAKHHRRIIKEFGRFPHRNKILNRPSTKAELAYLASPQAFTG
jgi:uncharacterized protein (DUF924 family)